MNELPLIKINKQHWEVRSKLEIKILIGFAIALVLLVFIGTMSYKNSVLLVKNSEAIIKNQRILYDAEQILSEIEYFESRARGYIISGNKTFLKSESESKNKIHKYIVLIRELTMQNKTQVAQVDSVEAILNKKMNFIDSTIAVRNELGFPASKKVTESEIGLELMNRIRSIIAKIKKEQNIFLVEDLKMNEQISVKLNSSIISLLACVICVLVTVFFMIKHNLKRRKFNEKKIRRLNIRLQSNISTLEALNTELEAFAFSASHDLKTSLSIISLNSGMLIQKNQSTLSKDQVDVLQMVIVAAKKMYRQIDSLLDFISLGKQEVRKTELDMEKIVKNVIDELKREQNSRARITINSLPQIAGDRKMIYELWKILLSNSIKYSGKKENPEIEIDSYTEQDQVVYLIRDNGVGFDMKYYRKLFRSFARLHGAEYESLGMGLAIAHRIIEKHGGRIWADAIENKGATFYFSLPSSETPANTET